MTTHEKMLLRAYRVRGQALHMAIRIESLMDKYIAMHFVKDRWRQVEFSNLLLSPRVTFENKFQVFQFLVNIYTPKFKETAPHFEKQLKDIIETRNMFAHYPADLSPEAEPNFEKDGSLTFYKFKNSGKNVLASTKTLSLENIKTLFMLMKGYGDLLQEITNDADTANPSA